MNPTKTKTWQELKELKKEQEAIHLSNRFKEDDRRFEKYSIETEALLYDYSKNHIDEKIMEKLLQFSHEQNIEESIKAFFSGEKINETEDRAVLHTALRNRTNTPVLFEGENVMDEVNQVLSKIEKFTKNVISGDFKGYTGKPISTIVNIGIGGSDLGPKMVVKALRKYQNHLQVYFVSNVDYAATEAVLEQIDIETTLFVIVSKTFTTIETLTNAHSARKVVVDYFKTEEAIKNHFVAVSTNIEEVTAFGIDQANIFKFWDWVGGRYSLWSSVGLSIALAVGYDNFIQLLEGAHKADTHFYNNKGKENIPLIMALLDVWYSNFFNYRSLAVIPYAEDLSLFAKFLQQLDMESNGKSVDKQGERIDYTTSNVIWGEAGTDSQHSFFQCLHQGTDIVPIDFIGYRVENKNKHDEILMSNLLAQSKALMEGTIHDKVDEKDAYHMHKRFEGNRPSSTFILKGISPLTIGYLTALYEHKVFTQGILWNVFSFDQWGVQLGKKLASSISSLTNNEVEKLDGSTKGLYQFMTSK